MSRRKILWLCSWYPGKFEPFNGDFIQRHAKAAALYDDIYMIHLYGDASGKIKRTTEEIRQYPHLTEHLVYFPKSRGPVGKLLGGYRWLNLFRRTIRSYIRAFGKPGLVHVHIPMKAGLFGLWMKRRYGIPYVLTEHWGIYNTVTNDNFLKRGRTFQEYTRRIFREASVFTSVSNFLGENVNQMVLEKEWKTIPNAVDTGLFHFEEALSSVAFRFLHVSNMIPLKNAAGILRSFRQLLLETPGCELLMVGSNDPALRALAVELGISNQVTFTGEIPYKEVALQMRQSHCLVMFSDIENSPCVIGEALCCGLPVIATRVGGIPELVSEENGILVEPRDEEALKQAMLDMKREYSRYDRKQIAEKAKACFSYPVIGKQFNEVYDGLK